MVALNVSFLRSMCWNQFENANDPEIAEADIKIDIDNVIDIVLIDMQ